MNAVDRLSLPALPPLVSAYLERALPRGPAAPASLRIEQRGTMWRTPGARGLTFTAEQRFDTTRIEFVWRARFPILPAVWLRVEDAFVDGRGRLEGRLWDRLRVMRTVGAEIDRGQILRYLAELAWNPFAIVRNPSLEWREIGRSRVEVAAGGSEPRAAVEIVFDARGDIERVFTPARALVRGKTTTMRPWGGRFWDYADLDRVRMPRCAEVWWDLPEGRFTYWRGELTRVDHAW
jgi:hypothetical protein